MGTKAAETRHRVGLAATISPLQRPRPLVFAVGVHERFSNEQEEVCMPERALEDWVGKYASMWAVVASGVTQYHGRVVTV